MSSFALEISLVGFLIEMVGIAIYFSKLIKNKIPKNPFGLFLSLFMGVLSGAMSLYFVIPNDFIQVLPVAVLSSVSLFMGVFFIYVLANKDTPIGELKVNVGDHLPPFKSLNQRGEFFSNEDLIGRRTLFKFYRGSWCPYCSRELKMFEEMKTDFDKHQVQIVALSGDSVEEAAHHKDRDNLSYTLLSDPKLDVVRAYGVEHQKALGADSKNIMTVLGLPFPMPHQFKFKSMSIPTSLLVDENGVICWIDQSEDYRLRASRERILEALDSSFGQ